MLLQGNSRWSKDSKLIVFWMVPEVHLQIIFKSSILISQFNLLVTVAQLFSSSQSQSQEYPFVVLHTNFLAFPINKSSPQSSFSHPPLSLIWWSNTVHTVHCFSICLHSAGLKTPIALSLPETVSCERFILHQVQDFFFLISHCGTLE